MTYAQNGTERKKTVSSQITIDQRNKKVRVWSEHNNQFVKIEVDFDCISSGEFTLVQIVRMRNSLGHDTQIALNRDRTPYDPTARVLTVRWS